MVDPQPSKALEFLQEAVERIARDGMFMSLREVEMRFDSEPWVLDELYDRQWGMRVGSFWSPSIRGLVASETPAAEPCLRGAKRVFEALQKLYREEKIKLGDDALVADEAGIAPEVVGRYLALLVPWASFVSGFVGGDTSWPARQVGLTDQLLVEDPFVDAFAPAPAPERGPVTLRLRNFRGLRNVEWSPEGVCLIAGPNGSGKTTLLEAFQFLSDAFQSTLGHAIRRQRGTVGLRHARAREAEGVTLSLGTGDVVWTLRLDVVAGGLGGYPEETVTVGSRVLVHRAAHSREWYLDRVKRPEDPAGRSCLRAAWEDTGTAELRPLVDVLLGFRYHSGNAVQLLRDGGKGGEDDAVLADSGENLFVVLRNWKTAPRRFDNRFDWVLSQLRRAFPGIVDDIEFDPPVGDVVPARLFGPGDRTGLPISRAADGFLVGLLHLTAVAGAPEGAVIAIDDMESQLHPHAIRSLLASMREAAVVKKLTVLLTTHSPVLINGFREQPQRFFITDVDREVVPVPVDKLPDPEWLGHFSLGDLYDRLEIGAPSTRRT